MWYTLRYANTFICAPAPGGRAGHPGGRSPVFVRLYGPPLPNPARQCRGPADDHHCTLPALHRPNCPQCYSCIPPARSRRAAAALVPPAYARRPSSTLGPARPCGPCCTRVRGPSASPRAGGRSQLAAEVSFAQGLTPRLVSDETIRVALRRLRRELEAGQTLDHQSRSRVCPKKKRRDQLIQRAMAQPSWALGFGDEVWWSRLAQPNQHCLDRGRRHA